MDTRPFSQNEVAAMVHDRIIDTLPTDPQRLQWRIDALFWAYLIFWGDPNPNSARIRAFMATRLLELGAIP